MLHHVPIVPITFFKILLQCLDFKQHKCINNWLFSFRFNKSLKCLQVKQMLVQHQKLMDLDSGIHTQACVFISSNGSSWLPPAILPLMHTHVWQQQTNSLSYACPRMWDCCGENERSNLSAHLGLTSTQAESSLKWGFL